MTCRLCAWLCERFCPPEINNRALWRANFDWEQDYAADWDPYEEDDELRGRWADADGLLDDNPAAALALHRELAEGGSVYSMLTCAWLHRVGRGTAMDEAMAEDFYRRALCLGSWKATIEYAELLFERGAHDKWPSTLGDGVDKGSIPSFFWLAWYRYKLSPSRKTAREVRHLLETAAQAGHPGAKLTLMRWTSSGKFGLGKIPQGFRMYREIVRSAIEAAGEGDKAGVESSASPRRGSASEDVEEVVPVAGQ